MVFGGLGEGGVFEGALRTIVSALERENDGFRELRTIIDALEEGKINLRVIERAPRCPWREKRWVQGN